MLEVRENQISNEEVTPGTFPNWLKAHLEKQIVDPRSLKLGGSARIMVVYPSEEARREILADLAEGGRVIDRTLHQTVESLSSLLVADFRLPRVLSTDSSFKLILHESCQREAEKLGFPLINPLPTMRWGMGKTTALSELHFFLSKERAGAFWEGPGINTFRQILRKIEKSLEGTHPDFVFDRLIERLDGGDYPFSLLDIDGIIMLNHAPLLSQSHIDLMIAISKHCPIHQLANKGSFRLGTHGILLEDKYPVKESKNLPEWVPRHELRLNNSESKVRRVLLQRESQSFHAAIAFADEKLRENSTMKIIIIDPNLTNNKGKWNRSLRDLGFPIIIENSTVIGHSLGHWLHSLIQVGHGPDSFSLDKLRALALQNSIKLFPEILHHSSNPEIRPVPDANLMSELARSDHILGGPGALLRWIETLSRPPHKKRDAIAKESTLWWLLSVVNSLRPVLTGADRIVFDECDKIGCFSGNKLPLSASTKTGDKWLMTTLSNFDVESRIENSDGVSATPVAVIQTIVKELASLRLSQSLVGFNQPRMGPDWVDQISTLLRSAELKSSQSRLSSRLRLLNPNQALGCSADLLILANTSSISWDLRVPKLPFLGDEERHEKNLLRPDGPIRQARHHRDHFLNCANEVIILDPSLDEATPATAPIREWSFEQDPDDDCERFELDKITLLSPRAHRQIDGKRMRQNIEPITPALNPDSITISLDSSLQRDRERRQPTVAEEDGYLPNSAKNHLFQFRQEDLKKRSPKDITPPRVNERWPVISARTGAASKEIRTVTIDPRPFTPLPVHSLVNDARHGHVVGAEQNISIWSASRLHDWVRCPRAGWLGRGLYADVEDLQTEDLDARTHGDLFHNVHHDLLCKILNFDMGGDREIDFSRDSKIPLSIAKSGIDEEQIMKIALEVLDDRAPWLNRSDAVSTNRVRMMTGMNLREWMDWTPNPQPTAIAGRIGRMIRAELELTGAIPLALEWELTNHDERGIEIELPAEITIPGGEALPSLRLRGMIDRVDLLSFDEKESIWFNAEGSESIAPLKIVGTDWKPRRLIAIRDLKTSESTKVVDRHAKGLLEELQLALYARAWEIAHPGDLVVAAGISVLGHKTTHLIEISNHFKPTNEGASFGKRTTFTHDRYRFRNEDKNPQSDPLRAWLAARISVALGVANGANNGRVHPTPSQDACKFCRVAEICDVNLKEDN